MVGTAEFNAAPCPATSADCTADLLLLKIPRILFNTVRQCETSELCTCRAFGLGLAGGLSLSPGTSEFQPSRWEPCECSADATTGKVVKMTGLVVDDPTWDVETLERTPMLAEILARLAERLVTTIATTRSSPFTIPTQQFDASLLFRGGPTEKGGCRQGSRAHWDTARTEHGFIVHVPSCTSQPSYSDSDLPSSG